MKKLKLKAFELRAAEVLTRGQLKKVVGGTAPGGNGCSAVGTTCKITCNSGWVVSGYCIATGIDWQGKPTGLECNAGCGLNG
jgi:hypothetical protein